MFDIQQQALSLMTTVKKHQSGESSDLMARLGADYALNYGISIVKLQNLAEPFGQNQDLADLLWTNKAREAKLLALFIADPEAFTPQKAAAWVSEFTTAEMGEQACMHLLPLLPFAPQSALQWCKNDNEYVKMTGFVLVSRLARVVKELTDKDFEPFLPLTVSESETQSVHVRRAISRALVEIGRISVEMNIATTKCCRKIKTLNTPTAKWIAEEALWQLEFFGEQFAVS